MASRLWQERERIGWCILSGSFLSLNQTSQREEMNPANHEKRIGGRRLPGVWLVRRSVLSLLCVNPMKPEKLDRRNEPERPDESDPCHALRNSPVRLFIPVGPSRGATSSNDPHFFCRWRWAKDEDMTGFSEGGEGEIKRGGVMK